MSAADTAKRQLGTRHWLLQILPPFAVLVPLVTTTSGSALVFLAGFFLIPVFFSLVSIVLKLIAYRQRKHFLLRPALTIVFFAATLVVAEWSYTVALGQATAAAGLVQDRCNTEHICPDTPDGWIADGRSISRRDLGLWHKYSASYYYDPSHFDIRVYHGPDVGSVISGGVGIALSVDPYVER